MSDDKIDQERSHHSAHELAETPFGAGAPADVSEPGPVETEPEVTEPSTEPVEAARPEEEQQYTMEAAMAAMDKSSGESSRFSPLKVGEVVEGVVVHVDREGVLVDVGTKSEGTIKPNELSRDPGANPEDIVAVGDRIKVYVVQTDSQDGGPILSKRKADFENAWDKVEHAFKTGVMLKAMVTDRVKGGLVVDLGIRGFVPASHVGSGKIKNLEKFVGQSMPFKVIEVDRERRKVVLSNRQAAEEEYVKMRSETMATLAEGQIREGMVRRLTDYGAFVDIGGVDGLLHISEMSWTRINHPSEAVKPGQKIQVMVLKIDLKSNRVSLGLRQILPDPWEDVRKLYSVGDVIKGTVTRIVPFGAFVQVGGGVEGIIPNSELAPRRVNNPEEVVSSGQEVEIKVIDLKPDERRLTLSLRQLQAPKERERDEGEYRSFTQARPETRMTIGDLIGEQLGGITFTEHEEAPKAPKKKTSRARAAKLQAMEEADALVEADDLLAEEEAVSEVPEAMEDAEIEKAAEAVEAEEVAELAEVEEVVEAAQTEEVVEAVEAVEETPVEEAQPEPEAAPEEIVEEVTEEAAVETVEEVTEETIEEATEEAAEPVVEEAGEEKSE